MTRRSHFVLSVLSLALVLGVGWVVRIVVFEDQRSIASAKSSANDVISHGSHTETSSAQNATSEPASSDAASTARSIAATKTADDRVRSATLAADLADAQWVHGRVHLPIGTPSDEQADVVAEGNAFDSLPSHRAPIAPDGGFRVAFSKATKRGRLRVEGRYLYSKEPFALKVDDPPPEIVLEPVLGGCIRGRFVLPSGASSTPSDVRDAVVQFGHFSSDRGITSFFGGSSVKLSDSLEFEVGHLSTSSRYAIHARLNGYVGIERVDLQVKTGAVELLDLPLQLGARISGHVQDESGAPIEGVEFASRRSGQIEPSFGDLTTARSSSDGKFDCAGLAPGEITLTASKEGYLSASLVAGRLAEGARRTEVVIVLRSGNWVAGRVQWADGRPAAACRIDIHQTHDASPSFDETAHDHHATTTEEGRFKITGLEKAPFTITARAIPESTENSIAAIPKSATSATAKKHKSSNGEWSARVEGVEAGNSALVLVLQPGKTLEGRVIDDTGQPIPYFSVQARPANQGENDSGSNESLYRSFHDADGSFRLSDLRDGAWSISVHAKGFANAARTCTVPSDSHLPDIVLPRGAIISGVVLDAGGNPVPKAQVRSEQNWNGSGAHSGSYANSEPSTDAAGRFEWKDVAPGSIQLMASAEGCADSAPVAIDVVPAQKVTGLTITLRAGGRLTGEVFDSTGRPDAHRTLNMSAHSSFMTHREFATDSSGHIDIEHLLPGTYDIQTDRSEHERVELGSSAGAHETTSTRRARVKIVDGETTHVILGARPRAPVRLFGVVTMAHRAVAGLRLNVSGRLTNGEGVSHQATSNEDGQYEVVVEEPGDWGFFLSLANGTSSGRHVTIPAASSYELDVALPSGTISGRVIDSGGQPIPAVDVRLGMDSRTAELSSIAAGGVVTSDATGRFHFDALPGGTYALEAGGSSDSSDSTRAPVYGKVHKNGLVLAEDGALTDIELRLAKPGRVDGIVLGSDGSPTANAQVFLRDEQGRLVSPQDPVYTDSKGRFERSGLSAGHVTVFARTEDLCSSESAPVAVLADASAHVEITLQPSALLRVIVEDAQGKRVGAMISVVDGNGRDFGPLNSANDDDLDRDGASLGRKFGPLPPGAYKVAATNHDKTSTGADAEVSRGEQKVVTLRFGG